MCELSNKEFENLWWKFSTAKTRFFPKAFEKEDVIEIFDNHQGGGKFPLPRKTQIFIVKFPWDEKNEHGRGFSRPNLNNMRMFHLRFPICQTLSDKLSWDYLLEAQDDRNEPVKFFDRLPTALTEKELYMWSDFYTSDTINKMKGL